MAHVVRKKLRRHYYLYLQRSIYKNKVRSTEHIKYIGPEANFSKEDISAIIKEYEESEAGKNENK